MEDMSVSEVDWEDEFYVPTKEPDLYAERWKSENEDEYTWEEEDEEFRIDEEEDTEEEPEQSCEKKAFTLDAAFSKKPWCKDMVKGDAMDSSSIHQSLCRAARLGHLEEMKLLVNQGADVNLGDDEEGVDVPLMYAVRSGNLEAVKFLVCSGADVNYYSDRLLNPFLYSEDSRNLAIIEFLISRGADVKAKSDDATPTLLHYAAWFASVTLVEYLVNNGYDDVNARDTEQATPLYNAISTGKLENVVFLLNHGADVNAKDQDYQTPLHFAVIKRNNVVSGFLSRSNVWKRNDEVRKRSLDIVRMLIHDGAELNNIDQAGLIPCHAAVHAQHLKICEYLGGEKLHEIDSWIPYYEAKYQVFSKIIRLLLDKGADINAEDKDGKTPRNLAINQLCRDLTAIKITV